MVSEQVQQILQSNGHRLTEQQISQLQMYHQALQIQMQQQQQQQSAGQSSSHSKQSPTNLGASPLFGVQATGDQSIQIKN